MNRNGLRRRGPRNRRQNVPSVRFVNNRIRALHLNAAPHWYEPKLGRRTRGMDVPSYVADTIYSRRVRLLFTVAATPATQTVTVANVYSAMGWTFGATSFTQLFVRRITIYGPDVGSLILTPFISNNATTAKDRDFSDFGVPGSRRCCIVVEISPKDTDTFTTNTGTICTFLGSVADSQVIVDLQCDFSGTTTTALGHPVLSDPTAPAEEQFQIV